MVCPQRQSPKRALDHAVREASTFLWLEQDHLEALAEKKKRFKKYAKWSDNQLLRMVGKAEWSKKSTNDKRAHAEHAFRRQGAGRGCDGKFEVRIAAEKPVEPEPTVSGPPGSSTDVAEKPAEVEPAVLTTSTKKSNRSRVLSVLVHFSMQLQLSWPVMRHHRRRSRPSTESSRRLQKEM